MEKNGTISAKNRFAKCHTAVFALAVCFVVVLFTGCFSEDASKKIGSEIWKQWPKITEGVFPGAPLTCSNWDCGRLEATSDNQMAETSLGYYLVHEGYLYYADKSNLEHWVPVCNQLDCEHFESQGVGIRCNAKIASSGIVIKDDRIFALVNASDYPELYRGSYVGKILISFHGNGTNRKLAFAPDAELFPHAIMEESVFNGQHWLYHVEELNTEGVMVSHLFRISEAGVKEVAVQTDTQGGSFTTSGIPTRIAYGINLFQYEPLGNTGSIWGFYQGDTYRTLDVSKLPSVGCYVYGDIARGFRGTDGYYDTNLETGAQVRLADARMDHSRARVLLPNCIIESTLFTADNPDVSVHNMELFDGETWRKVELPDNLALAKNISVSVLGVASDRIFFAVRNPEVYFDQFKISLYSVSLCAEKLEMEFCTDIEQVVPNV